MKDDTSTNVFAIARPPPKKTGICSEKNEESRRIGEAEENDKSTKRKRVIFCILVLAYFSHGCGFSIPAPFFPREAASKNVSSTTIGFVFGCFQLVNFISSLIFGQLLPLIGPKRLCTTGIIIAGGSSLLFGFLDKAQSRSLFVAFSFILRILEGMGVAACSTASFAIICTEFEDRVATTYAMLEASIAIGLMVGPTVGGALYGVGGFGAPFWVVGALIIITGFLVLAFLPPIEDKELKPSKNSMLKLLSSGRVWVAMMLLFDGSCAVFSLHPTLSLHLSQFDLSPFVISLFFVIIPVFHASVTPLWGYICDKKQVVGPLMQAACLASTVAFLLMGPSPLIPTLPKAIWLIILALVLFGLFFGCTLVPTMKCFVTGAREVGLPDNMGTFGIVAGLFNSVLYFGGFVGPLIGGAMMETIGFEWGTTVIAAMFLATSGVLASFFASRRLQRDKHKTPKNGSVHSPH